MCCSGLAVLEGLHHRAGGWIGQHCCHPLSLALRLAGRECAVGVVKKGLGHLRFCLNRRACVVGLHQCKHGEVPWPPHAVWEG
jgi:hypothetical protein